MLRSIKLAIDIVRAIGVDGRILPAWLRLGASAGRVASGLVHDSLPDLMIALAIALLAGNALLDVAYRIHGSGFWKRAVLALVVAIGPGAGSGVGQERTDAEQTRDILQSNSDRFDADAEAFARQVLDLARSNQSASEIADVTRERLIEGMGQAADMLDVEGFHPEDLMGPDHSGPVVYVFVSLGMPDDALQRYVREAYEVGAVVVIRGFVGNSFARTQERIIQLFDQETIGGVAIDPRPFQAFGIDRVPAIVYADHQVEPCGGLGCVVEAPRHDIVRGNISISAALELFGEDAPAMPAQ